MVIAVCPVRVMEVAAYQVVLVIAVRYHLVSASGTVPVRGIVAIALVIRRAPVRVRAADSDRVLLDRGAGLMLQVSVLQVISVVVVADGHVAAARAMLVRVVSHKRPPIGRGSGGWLLKHLDSQAAAEDQDEDSGVLRSLLFRLTSGPV